VVSVWELGPWRGNTPHVLASRIHEFTRTLLDAHKLLKCHHLWILVFLSYLPLCKYLA